MVADLSLLQVVSLGWLDVLHAMLEVQKVNAQKAEKKCKAEEAAAEKKRLKAEKERKAKALKAEKERKAKALKKLDDFRKSVPVGDQQMLAIWRTFS